MTFKQRLRWAINGNIRFEDFLVLKSSCKTYWTEFVKTCINIAFIIGQDRCNESHMEMFHKSNSTVAKILYLSKTFSAYLFKQDCDPRLRVSQLFWVPHIKVGLKIDRNRFRGWGRATFARKIFWTKCPWNAPKLTSLVDWIDFGTKKYKR